MFFQTRSNVELAALNCNALSLMISTGVPLWETNLFRARRNSSVDISNTISRWTARITRHVNRQTQTFLEPSLVLIYIGPKSSSPVLENGFDSLTRMLGKGGMEGIWYGPSSLRRQIKQECRTDRTIARPWGIQYLYRMLLNVCDTPLWRFCLWFFSISKCVNLSCFGNKIGRRVPSVKSAYSILPLHRSSPSLSIYYPSCLCKLFDPLLIIDSYTSEKFFLWTFSNHIFSATSNSWFDMGPLK